MGEILKRISARDITFLIIGFIGLFVGRFVLFAFASPLALAYASSFVGMRYFVVAGFVLLGVASKLEGLFLVKYIVAFVILSVLKNGFKNKSNLVQAVFVGISVLVSGLFMAVLKDMSLYFTIAAIVEAVFSTLITLVMQKSGKVLAESYRPRSLDAEELISISLLFMAVIVACSDLQIGVVQLSWIFMTLILLITAYHGGGAFAAAMGTLFSVGLGLFGSLEYGVAAILGMASIASGIFRARGKFATALGFITGFSVSALYVDKLLINGEIYSSMVLAAVVFLVLPKHFYFNINTLAQNDIYSSDEYLERAKTVLGQRLYSFSGSFEKLSRTFNELSVHKSSLNKNDINMLIDDVAAKACNNCKRNSVCWQSNFYDTYQTVFSILSACEKKSRIDVTDIPEGFRKSCTNVSWFAEVTNRLFEIYKINMAWQNRIVESRALISEQLGGVSKLIQSLAGELDLYMNFKVDLEESIREELARNKIDVANIIVLEDKHGKYEVSIMQKKCIGRGCSKEIIKVVSRLLNKKMRIEDTECGFGKESCRLRIVEEQKYKITSGVARMAKSGSKESGDNYSCMELKNGEVLLALSDGMGSGRRANEESAAAVDLLEDFIESGFEKDMAIKMINSVLVLKSDDESFSTLDICSIDLNTGLAEFIKIGAASTYILRDGAVSVIKSSSLPIGMLNTVDLEVSSKQLRSGDILVMVTDGLTDFELSRDFIADGLRAVKHRNPQEVADFLLTEAIKKCEGKLRDDMTVLTARIWQKS